MNAVATPKLILIIEDDADISESLKELLETEGFAVQLAGNGAEGLKALESIHPSMILLDLMMPVMDGRGFLREYSQRAASKKVTVPVVLITAAGQESKDIVGVTSVLRKPLDIDQLLVEVYKHCGLRS